MSVSEETLRRDAVINNCGNRMKEIKNETYSRYRIFRIFGLCLIYRDLCSVNAKPEDIDSSHGEFETLLAANGC